jgi:hypothetical protein
MTSVRDPATESPGRILVWLQSVAVLLVVGVAGLLTIAAIPYGGLNFHPFDPNGPGLIDPKDVLPGFGAVDEFVETPIILYGMFGALVSGMLAALGMGALTRGAKGREITGTRRYAITACTILLAAHTITMFTPFGVDVFAWLAD